MSRWFWYLSPQKIASLKRPRKGWGFLKEKLGHLELEAGIPWAKLKSNSTSESTAAADIERIEKDIYHSHKVPPAEEITEETPPLFFSYEGSASRLVLMESYKGEDGECVFMLVGMKDNIGVILLGSGANVFGSSVSRSRHINPSGDPVGILLVNLEYNFEGKFFTRAGIDKTEGLSVEEKILMSFTSALKECQETTVYAEIKALAVFSAIVEITDKNRFKSPVNKIVIGSPIYVEQIDMYKP